jgi:hypothetical protein
LFDKRLKTGIVDICTDPDVDPDPDPAINKGEKVGKTLISTIL